MFSRGRTWDSHLSSAKPRWALTAESSRTIPGLQSHPQYRRDSDSIFHCRAHMRVWKQTCWSIKIADWCSDGSSIPFYRPLSWSVPMGICLTGSELWQTGLFLTQVPLEWAATHFQIPRCLSELATLHSNLQREFYKERLFLVSTRHKQIWLFSLQSSSDKH